MIYINTCHIWSLEICVILVMKTTAWNGAERGVWGVRSTKVEQFTISKRRGETIPGVKVVPPISCMAWPAPSPPLISTLTLLTTFSMSLIRHPREETEIPPPSCAVWRLVACPAWWLACASLQISHPLIHNIPPARLLTTDDWRPHFLTSGPSFNNL